MADERDEEALLRFVSLLDSYLEHQFINGPSFIKSSERDVARKQRPLIIIVIIIAVWRVG